MQTRALGASNLGVACEERESLGGTVKIEWVKIAFYFYKLFQNCSSHDLKLVWVVLHPPVKVFFETISNKRK